MAGRSITVSAPTTSSLGGVRDPVSMPAVTCIEPLRTLAGVQPSVPVSHSVSTCSEDSKVMLIDPFDAENAENRFKISCQH